MSKLDDAKLFASLIKNQWGPTNTTNYGGINWTDYGINNILTGGTDEDITSNIKSLYKAINNSSWDDASLSHWLDAIKEGGDNEGDYSGLANTLSAARDQNNRYFDDGVFNQELAKGDINKLYGEQLLRNATFGPGSAKDADYWVDRLKAGDSIQDVIGGIQGSSEFTNQALVADALGFGDISRDAWTADQQAMVDKYVLPGGITTAGFDSLGLTAGDPTWSGSITEQNTIANTLGINAANPTSTWSDSLNTHTDAYDGDDIMAGLYNLDASAGDGNVIDDTITGAGGTDTLTGSGGTDTLTGAGGNDTITGGGGGGGGISADEAEAMFNKKLQALFSNPWTPYGYGWGGHNTSGVAINKSNASKMGGPYAGNKSSFGRQGYRLATTPQGSNSY